MNPQGKLFIVATPIGNLSDMTPRAIDCLNRVDVIACEDTRTSAKLLNHFNITTKTIAYHDHNADSQTAKLIELLTQGKQVALISDAGTPLVSDPGFRLVKACHDANIGVSPIVGASAVIGALSVAGLPSNRFYFVGFLPAKATARQGQLAQLKTITATLIFYEAPHRILACVSDMIAVFGADRKVTFCREISKTFETIYQTTLQQLKTFIETDVNQQKGEMVLVVAGFEKPNDDENIHDDLLRRVLQDLSVKQASQLVADITGAKKNALYQRALQLSNTLLGE
ncbi:uroporphyrin-III C/tetrapyrrole methyltransferase [Moraxella macacae 0408225]|uniref:Ribosomal RNA small subunit methyltransferase I n=1 Tax=Moraxella macacae 0408225 TaxID=1230338 RepID=L2F803_9GAMM|nr:16S rRNA (cytidine(1402)-2'-O)-methyltransferase [Moraxella macacae]ELA09162.1 uroporphyrin-III C/tetrapyrrole methyltransferase [Moraxella macacae 0408225]